MISVVFYKIMKKMVGGSKFMCNKNHNFVSFQKCQVHIVEYKPPREDDRDEGTAWWNSKRAAVHLSH
jgi:hypothetical protein